MHARAISNLPSSDFDLAFVVSNETSAQDVEKTLERAAGELATSIELFDVFRGQGVEDGSRSLTFHIRLEPTQKTLTEADISKVREQCLADVFHAHGAILRA